MDEVFARLRVLLLERLSGEEEFSDQEIRSAIDEIVLSGTKDGSLTVKEKVELSRDLFYSVRKLDLLQELVEDPAVTEIMVNGPDRIYVERNGRITLHDRRFPSAEKLSDVIRQIVGSCNRVINEQRPIADARLPDGSRVNAVVPPVALNGPILTIRRFPEEPITMEKLIAWESITKEAADFLSEKVRARRSIMISGGTSAGKTTFLNALTAFVPGDERLITIEDNAELQIQGIDNLVRLEAKSANLEGGSSIPIRDLIRTSLRMRPDRIIVGEVRGEEAVDLLQALNTGHDGSLCTIHANTAKDSLQRLETMTLMGLDLPLYAIRQQIVSGVNYVVHLARFPDRARRVSEILRVDGLSGTEFVTHPLFSFDPEQKRLTRRDGE